MQRNGTQVQVRRAAVPRYGPLPVGTNDKGSVIVHTPAHFLSQSAGHEGREPAGAVRNGVAISANASTARSISSRVV